MKKIALKKTVSETDLQAMEIKGLNMYLAAGNGRGRLNSAATVYNGKVGYFFVSGTAEHECILFSCSHTDENGTSNEDVVITEFPAHPNHHSPESKGT